MRVRLALVACALAALAGAAPASAAEASDARPNVLLIVTDDQRADGTLGVMPATRRIFKDGGADFTNAFVTTPLCCPSRGSIFTGNYVHNHYQFFNDINASPAPFNNRLTMERYLKRAGYRTGIVGKFLNGWPLERKPPYFDDYWTHEAFYYRSRWNLQGRLADVREYSTKFIGNRALEFMHNASREAKPWFLYVATNAPHGPLVPERKYKQADVGPDPTDPAVGETDVSDKPPFLARLSQGLPYAFDVRRGQLRTLISVDDMVAKIFKELRRTGQDRNTLMIFTSDNGLFWGEHGGLAIKDLPYDPAVRVPLLVRWPGHVSRGSTIRRLAANIDLAPTILGAAGAGHPATDGIDLLSRARHDHLLLEYGGLPKLIPSWAAIRTPSALYSEYYETPAEEVTTLPSGAAIATAKPSFVEYYDLLTDPYQLNNLAAPKNASIGQGRLDQLSAQLRRDLACRARSCP